MIKVSQGSLGSEELERVKEAFAYNYFGHAYMVEEFEQEISRVLTIDKEHVVACNTGTSALQLALSAVGVGSFDEVIIPSLTFVATAQAVSALGAVPVSCDVYENNLLLDLQDVRKKINGKTKAVIPVHYCGNPCEMSELLKIGKDFNLRIIEDAAHCFGGTYKGMPIGSFGDITCFSFDSLKIISCGEGGAVVSRDSDVIRTIKLQRLLGMDKSVQSIDHNGRALDYDVRMQGYRFHMSNINAAIGLAQIKKLDRFIDRRREICRLYKEGLKDNPLIEFLDIDYDGITPFMFVVKVKERQRNNLKGYLLTQGIETAIKYAPVHMLSYYQKKEQILPVTDRIYDEILELPLHCILSDEDVSLVIESINKFRKDLV